MEQKRIIWLDIARGLAMLCVIYGHVLPRNAGFGKWIYSWHMPIFFIITGILLSQKDNWKQMTYCQLFKKDTKSIMYPYIIFNVIEVIIMSFTSSIKDALTGVFHFCILDGLQALWFLSALFVARQIFFQLIKHINKKEIIIVCVIIIIVVSSMISIAGGWLANLDGNMRITEKLYKFAIIYNRSLIGFIFLILGFECTNYLRSFRFNCFAKIVLLVCLLVFSAALFDFNSVDLHLSSIGNPLLFYLLAIVGSACIFISSDILSHFFLSTVICFVGRNSIVFLITHIPIRDMLAFFLPSIDKENKMLFFIILIVVEYGIVWLITRYLPRLYRLKG